MAANAAAMARLAVSRWGLTGAAVLSLTGALPGGTFGTAWARAPQVEPPAIAIAKLPPEARNTYQLIHTGGPFPYEKDGSVFLNRERHLPQKARGYYREYTVKTPRARDRGPRRIVCGGQPPTAPQDCFYTADHYASFSRITTAQ